MLTSVNFCNVFKSFENRIIVFLLQSDIYMYNFSIADHQTIRNLFYQNTQKSNVYAAPQVLAACFCIKAINLSPNLVSVQFYFSGHLKTQELLKNKSSPNFLLQQRPSLQSGNLKLKKIKSKLISQLLQHLMCRFCLRVVPQA